MDASTTAVNSQGKPPERGEWVWPVVGLILGALAGTNPLYRPHLTLEIGIAASLADVALVLILSVHPISARVGVIVTGLFLAVPCFLRESPLSRGLLMCCMALPYAVAALSLSVPATAGLRGRLGYFFTWLGTCKAQRCARRFDTASLLRLVCATAVLAATMACVKAVPAAGPWLLARWLAGGLMLLAFAELMTASHGFVTALMGLTAAGLMCSPHLSTSLTEFWSKRWNPAASSLIFRKYGFAPLARKNVTWALVGAFLLSAVAHFLLPYMAMGKLGVSIMCGAFFLVQPPLILLERRMKIRRWRPAAQRAWTLSALAVTSPLFVEPALQLVEPSWGSPGSVLLPALATLTGVMMATVFFAIAFLAFGSEPAPSSSHRAAPLTG